MHKADASKPLDPVPAIGDGVFYLSDICEHGRRDCLLQCSSGSMILHWLFFLLQVHVGLGAYVQWTQCDNHPTPTSWALAGLEATLSPIDTITQMSLALRDSPNPPECEGGPDLTSATIEIILLGHSKTFSSDRIGGTCAVGQSAQGNSSSERYPKVLSLSQSLDNLYPLSTFQLGLHLYTTNQTAEAACFSALITPEIPRSARNALFYGPLAGLITVLIMTYCRKLFDDNNTLESDSGNRSTGKNPPAVNGISDYLQHLQFVFLTACLSLSYPGFFQPAVRSLNWFSLFSSSNAFLGGYSYAGISDGIFETNGSYGGTYGMEHMIQNLGAPMTMEIWINMVILILIVLAAVAILVLVHRFIYRRVHPSESEDQASNTVQQFITDTLRMVLSYFIQPIIAVSAYQLDHIGMLPTYLVSMAVLLIVLIFAAYVWLFRQTSAERLAALVMEVPGVDRGTQRYRRDLRAFVLVHFTLTFLRGIVIGAVQISGAAQVGILMFCEVFFIGSVWKFVPSLLRSTITFCAAGRFVALSLMIAFLVPSASISTKSLVAYIILALELFILVVIIFIPQIYKFVKFWLLHVTSSKPQVSYFHGMRGDLANANVLGRPTICVNSVVVRNI